MIDATELRQYKLPLGWAAKVFCFGRRNGEKTRFITILPVSNKLFIMIFHYAFIVCVRVCVCDVMLVDEQAINTEYQSRRQ